METGFCPGPRLRQGVDWGKEKRMPPELVQWIPPVVIIAVLLYIHRSLRQDMREVRREVRELR